MIAFHEEILLEFIGMKSDLLKNVVDNLLNKLYSFAHSIIPDELQAEQLIIDSYSVFILNHKKQLEQIDYKSFRKDARVKISVRNYVYKHMLQSIYELGLKRCVQLNISQQSELEKFYKLTPTQRAILHLQEILELNQDEVRQILRLEAHEILEQFYNAQNTLLSNSKIEIKGNEAIHGP